MQKISDTLTKANKGVVTAILALFILHFMSIHVVANALVICFEENGDVNVESVAGSFLTIPSEDQVHNEASHDHSKSTVEVSHSHHSDVAFSNLCSKEQRTTRYDQQRTLAYLDGILNTAIEELPRSRVFQLASFIPPLIEDFITTNLQTVVLLN
ncbi:MAG: hypothetical protein FH748_13635 [Balneolaceae bacterium]|nr:hypothetical protein [Balneolaceae bacterium]